MQKFWDDLRGLFTETLKEWREDNAASVAAALAYYAIFSLSPLLIIFALFLGLVIGSSAAENEVLSGVESALGNQGVEAIESAVDQSETSTSSNVFSVMLWLAVVFWGVSGLFQQLQKALNIIWEVRLSAKAHRLVFLKNRLLSFSVVIVASLLLILSTIINTSLSNLELEGGLVYLMRLGQLIFSLSLLTLLFASIFKILPDVLIHWRDVLVGAFFTACLFIVGQIGVGLYINNSNIGSVYGAAGSLTIILVWIYYSAQILLFGAEFTEVWARRHGADIHPDADAEWVNPEKAARERALSPKRQTQETKLDH